MFGHQQKDVDHLSGQAKNKIFSFWYIFDFFQIIFSNILFFLAEMIFLRSEIQYYYCTISENSISEVFQRFKSEIFNFQFLFHEKSDFFSFCLTTFMIHNFLLVTEHLWKTPEMEFSDRLDIV